MLRVSEDGDRRRTAHAAGYGDLGRTLLDLQAAADQIFDAVTKRTAEEREKLSGISTRIKAAKRSQRSDGVRVESDVNPSST
uniref:Uncharacterized protein n=1 Tax=Setaria italica TaxID=4555 RepID=K4AHE6_SETIT